MSKVFGYFLKKHKALNKHLHQHELEAQKLVEVLTGQHFLWSLESIAFSLPNFAVTNNIQTHLTRMKRINNMKL